MQKDKNLIKELGLTEQMLRRARRLAKMGHPNANIGDSVGLWEQYRYDEYPAILARLGIVRTVNP